MTENNMKFHYNFQPMPKRFMVWDTVKKKFFEDRQGNKVFTLHTLLDTLGSRFYLESEWRICQSTNLFDKDDEEIFEGSIIHTLITKWVVKQDKGCMCAFNYHTGVVMPLYKIDMGATKVVGHILSNPELVEEK